MARILIVDDEAPVRATLTSVLEDMGFRTASERNGESALQWLGRERADLVLADVRKHGVGGLEVLRLSRALHPDLPVVMITGYADQALAREALRNGAIDFLVKPLDLEVLEDRISRLLPDLGVDGHVAETRP